MLSVQVVVVWQACTLTQTFTLEHFDHIFLRLSNFSCHLSKGVFKCNFASYSRILVTNLQQLCKQKFTHVHAA